MHKVFISYHHANDQFYKERLLQINAAHNIFIDASVDTGDVSDALDDQSIRAKIRDEYLRDSSVTILLVGTETQRRKHVDWELYSSMIDGAVNKRSGTLVVTLPTIACTYYTAAHDKEQEIVFPDCSSWTTITDRTEYERRYPYLPARIIDQLMAPNANVSVINWERIEHNPAILTYLIEGAYRDRTKCDYDLSRAMRRANS